MKKFLSAVLVMFFASFASVAAAQQGWSVEGRYFVGQTTTRLSYGALSVSGTSDFRSYGITVAHSWQLGESPYRLSAVGGLYGGGVSESGSWSNGADSLQLSYDQPLSGTFGVRLSAVYGNWSPYVEAGLVLTRHQLDGSLTQGGVTTYYQETAMTHGPYGEIGVSYSFSEHGRLNVAIHGRRTSRGAVEQTTLAASLGATWRF